MQGLVQGLQPAPGSSSAFARGTALRPRSARPAPPRREASITRAVGWDPEDILRPPEVGAINRRMYTKKLQADASFLKQEEKRLTAVKEEQEAKRAARVVPSTPKELVEYLLSTEADEMNFELTPTFFEYLAGAIRDEKFSPRSRTERVEELEGLQVVAQQGVAKAEAAVAQLLAPAERLRKLFAAPDKKACILAMAAENELDEAFMELLEQNIDGARAAGQADAQLFMEKLRNACRKFAVAKPAVEVEAPPAAAPTLPGLTAPIIDV